MDEDFVNTKAITTGWDRLSEDEKKEIKAKAAKKREDKERLDNIKAVDIMTGRQRTLDNSWE